MSLRQALRSRFKGEGKPGSPGSNRRSKETKTTADDEQSYESIDFEDDCDSFQSASSSSPVFPDTPDGEFKDNQEKTVFELQLTQLQEQMVAVMIENQSLRNELKESNEKQVVLSKVKHQLESEKKRNDSLETKIKNYEQKGIGSLKLKRKAIDAGQKSSQHIEPAIDIASDLQKEDVVNVPDGEFSQTPVQSKKTLKERLFESVLKRLYNVIDDFSEEMEFVHVEENVEADPLTGKRLKENIKRFGSAAKPYYDTGKGLFNLISWKTPPYTLIVFLVYMYMVWRGWFLQTLLACLTFRLFIQFLIYRGWNIQFNFIDAGEIEEKESDESLGLSDKFNLVIEVATKVQNTLGQAADSLEKIKSLLTWRHPEASNHLFLMVSLAFITSCVLSGAYLFEIMGLMMGIKLFIIDIIYQKFPRIKMKYDTSHVMWLSLPTDSQYEKKHMKSEIDKYILKHGHLPEGEEVEGDIMVSGELTNDDKSFCQLFSLPTTESPLPGWQGGRMCTLINREKSLASAFKSGKLYLTRSFLCFERSKTPSPKNLVIPLANIGNLEKAKPYSWLPGGGMSIEVTLANSDKSFIFGGLMNRDETFDMISEIGMLSQLPWATGIPIQKLHITRRLSDLSKRINPQKFKNFSIGMICDDK